MIHIDYIILAIVGCIAVAAGLYLLNEAIKYRARRQSNNSLPPNEHWRLAHGETQTKGALLDVVAVKPDRDFRLHLEFENGEKKVFDARPYLEKGALRQLKDERRFMQAYVDYGTVCWPGNLDIAPETLYDRSEPLH